MQLRNRRRHALAQGVLVALGAAFIGIALAAPAGNKARDYEHHVSGNLADATATVTPAKGSAPVVLMGGASDVDAAFLWMIDRAAGGDFVVLRASGDGAYNAYLMGLSQGRLDSVETLVFKHRDAAFDPVVLARVQNAEAVFIAGGDQSDYMALWKDTPLEAVLNGLLARDVPVGGISAGLAVLGPNVFSAARGTITSGEALADPYHRRVTLERDFLAAPALGGVITDSHFGARDRMGRLLTFVARLVTDGWVGNDAVRGIGVDEGAALVVENAVATRLGEGSAYFLRPTAAPLHCAPRQALTLRNVTVQRLSGGGRFDLGTWSGPQGDLAVYDVSAEAGVLTSSQTGGSAY